MRRIIYDFGGFFMYIYAIGNIHSFYDYFEEALVSVDLSGDNILVFLGDYIRFGPDSYKILDKIMALEAEYGTEKVIAICGYQEMRTLVEGISINSNEKGNSEKDNFYVNWLKTLKPDFRKENYVFNNDDIFMETELRIYIPLSYKDGKLLLRENDLNRVEDRLSPLFIKMYVEHLNDERDFDSWFPKIKVVNHQYEVYKTYEEYLQDRIEEYVSVDHETLAEIKKKIKQPKVVKIDLSTDSGENIEFWWQGKWICIEKTGLLTPANYIVLGSTDMKS
jgi:hypothetical protein